MAGSRPRLAGHSRVATKAARSGDRPRSLPSLEEGHAPLRVTTGQSFVYTLPLVDKPAAADLAVFHQYGPGNLPDGIAFGASGLLYVAMATPAASGVSILAPGGAEKRRLANPPGSTLLPYDTPANIDFNGTGSILLSNHAFVTGVVNPKAFTVLDVFVDDQASPLEKPLLP